MGRYIALSHGTSKDESWCCAGSDTRNRWTRACQCACLMCQCYHWQFVLVLHFSRCHTLKPFARVQVVSLTYFWDTAQYYYHFQRCPSHWRVTISSSRLRSCWTGFRSCQINKCIPDANLNKGIFNLYSHCFNLEKEIDWLTLIDAHGQGQRLITGRSIRSGPGVLWIFFGQS